MKRKQKAIILLKFIETQNISQEELSIKLNMPLKSIKRVMTNKCDKKINRLFRIASLINKRLK